MATIDSLIVDLNAYTNTPTTVLTNSVAAECVNLAMRKMARKHSFAFLQVTADFTVGGGLSGTIALPPGWIEEIQVYTKDPTQSDPSKALFPINKIQRWNWFAAINPIANVDPNFPQVAAPALRSWVTDVRYYFIWQEQLTVVPTPTQPITVTVDYVVSSDLTAGLTPAAQNGFTTLYPDAVRDGALAEAYRFLHDWSSSTLYEDRFDKALTLIITHDDAQMAAGPSRQRGT